ISYINFFSNYEPTLYHQVVEHLKWRQALDALEVNSTWSFLLFPLDKHCIGCRWVYNLSDTRGPIDLVTHLTINKSLDWPWQASRQWFYKFFTILLATCFTQSKHDYSLFTIGGSSLYRALFSTASEITWLKQLLRHFEVYFTITNLHCSLHLTLFTMMNINYKHIDIHYHFIKELSQARIITRDP
ncbi:hypothetical protein CR513_12834, partial [Mucuna pruriens]